jgi:hypothetical protein
MPPSARQHESRDTNARAKAAQLFDRGPAESVFRDQVDDRRAEPQKDEGSSHFVPRWAIAGCCAGLDVDVGPYALIETGPGTLHSYAARRENHLSDELKITYNQCDT